MTTHGQHLGEQPINESTAASGFDGVLRRWFARNYHLAAAFILYLPFVFLGYGEEADSYIIVRAGKQFLATHSYIPSRRPGAAAYEIPHALLNLLGGSVLSNLGSLAASIVFLACFTWILKRYEVPNRHRLIWGLILLPMYWNNSTVTQDYVWAMAFALAGFTLTLRRSYVLGGIFWGIAVGSRATSVIMVFGFLIFLSMIRWSEKKQIALAAIVGAVVGIACFSPMLLSATPFAFLHAANWGDAEMWTPYLRAGRFVYKNIYILGIPATITAIVAIFFCIRDRRMLWEPNWRPLVAMSLFIVLAHEAMFLQYPMKPEYLLPAVPFLLIIFGVGLQRRPIVLTVLVLSIASYAVFNIDLARPDVPWRATGATYGLFPEKGRLIKIVEARWKNRHCETIDCVAQVNEGVLRKIESRQPGARVLF